MAKQNKAWLAIIILVFIFLITVSVSGKGKKDKGQVSSPDMITIDSMTVFGELEKPAVNFFHDKHTNALEKKGKDCKACHKEKDDKLSPIFMRLKDTDQQEVMNIYHDGCIGCHKDTAAKGDKSGPVICGECHKEKPYVVSSRQPMGLDKSLHYRHSKAYDKKCETCHTDCKTGIYKKDSEGTCRYCHKDVTEEDRISMEEAAHASCVDCHMNVAKEKKETGPVKCGGCHDQEKQQAIKRIDPAPRLDRNQPDLVMIKTGNKALDAPGKARMNLVPFNHKGHEEAQDTCRVCHHGELSACNKCHTIEGSKDGQNISLEKAMHMGGADNSCRGCHQMTQQEKECAGCHVFLDKKQKQDDLSCAKCHVEPLAGFSGDDEAIAKKLLASRRSVSGTYPNADIPEKVVIKQLVDQYDPAEFPHRKVVNKLVEDTKNNELAAFFHSGKGTICQGCHHNSPASKKPTLCGSCHGKTPDEENPFKPGIKAAYHLQCMGCHSSMKIDKTGCTDCHMKK